MSKRLIGMVYNALSLCCASAVMSGVEGEERGSAKGGVCWKDDESVVQVS